MLSPSEQLNGKNLDGGWKVIELIKHQDCATGGNFSVCYIVESDNGRKAFLKALDISRASLSDDPAKTLEKITSAFNFERDLYEKCKDCGLSRVVTAITDGKVIINSYPVQYLIFELADGDIRKHLHILKKFDIAWILRSLHHIASGIQQLHGIGIAHQDIKPSNVLVFNGNSSKIADLGRSSYKGSISQFDKLSFAGDPAYAPPELLYGYISPDWNKRRLGCDSYLFGSMVVYFFTQVGMTAQLLSEMHKTHHPRYWNNSYDEVLPYIRDAFSKVIDNFKKSIFPEIREELIRIVSDLCEPDPSLRGHPRDRAMKYGNQYSVERYISIFNTLAEKAEHNLIWLKNDNIYRR